MFTGFINRIRNWGVSKAIDALDLVEPILATRIEKAKEEFKQMDSESLAKYIVDQVQDTLRTHFKIEKPEKENA